MLSLPRTENEDGVIPVDETSATLDTLLRMISGMNFDVPDSEDVLMAVILSASKYSMPGPLAIAKGWILPPKIQFNPIRLFNVGCRVAIPELEKEGLRRSLEIDIREPVYQPLLEELHPQSLLQIIHLRRMRVELMYDFFEELIGGTSSHFLCSTPKKLPSSDPTFPCCRNCRGPLTVSSSPEHGIAWRALQRRVMVELSRCPSGDKFKNRQFEDWNEVTSGPLSLVCTGGRCFAASYNKAQVLAFIRTRVAALPISV